MKNATMLYRAPGPHDIHGAKLDHIIVDADAGDDLEDALADGWFLTTPEAIEAYAEAQKPKQATEPPPADDAPVTRAELEAKANELEIKFDGRTSDKKLAEAIEAKLKG